MLNTEFLFEQRRGLRSKSTSVVPSSRARSCLELYFGLAENKKFQRQHNTVLIFDIVFVVSKQMCMVHLFFTMLGLGASLASGRPNAGRSSPQRWPLSTGRPLAGRSQEPPPSPHTPGTPPAQNLDFVINSWSIRTQFRSICGQFR